jgi:tetratricopeptide (TPR) repeat protein
MEIEEIISPSDSSAEGQRISRRQMTQNAIALAMQSRWQEAADANRQIVELAPDDAEAYNRLGKAYTELGRIDEAREAYEKSIAADPANLIGQRNLERLSGISETEAEELRRKAGAQKLDPRFFMEETGRTRVTVLVDIAPSEALTTLTAGDRVTLEASADSVAVSTVDGTPIGKIEDLEAARLSRLMQTGNEYQAGIVGVDGSTVRVIIRETYRSPENAGRISFPPRVSQEMPRPYVREGLVRRAAGEEEDEDDLDTEHDEAGDDDEEDASELGFHEDEA